MGCCISTNTESPGSKKHVGSDEASSKLKGFSHESRAPPPPPSVEEETVKEVLSETPKPIPPQPEPAQVKQYLQEEEEEEEEEEEKETKISAHRVEAFAKIPENQNLGSNEEIMSEFCSDSISESVSTMTNVTDKRDNEEEEEEQRVRQRKRVVSRSPAKQPPRNGFKRDRVVNQSPSRRSDQSHGSRIGNGSSVKLVQYQESGRVNGLIRRDPSESSGRRSRSPATTRSSAPMGRSPSARRSNRSPGRVGSGQTENNNATTSINSNSRRKMEAKRAGDNSNDNCSTNESIENPLVSLECFIFL